MISDDETDHQVSYWPSVSDLFMTLFITAIALVGVVLFVFLVNPGKDVFAGRIIELREVLGLPPLPPQTARDDPSAVDETIKRAIEQIKACEQLREDVDALTKLRLEVVRLTDEVAASEQALRRIEQDRERLSGKLNALQEELARLRGEKGRNDKPPIITVASDVLFPSGGVTVNETASDSLRVGGFKEIAAEILKRNANDQQLVDTLEIIGHTDGVPMKGARGNLDTGLPAVLAGTVAIDGLKPGSNNDLGLLRALAIKRAWQQFVLSPRPERERTLLEAVALRTYSAGQTVPFDPDGPVDDERSRRIELRLTKLGVGPPTSPAQPSSAPSSPQ